jgi:hypothetical protein
MSLDVESIDALPHLIRTARSPPLSGERCPVTNQQKGTHLTYSVQTSRTPLRSLHRSTAVLLTLLAALFAACALSVKLVGDYDDLLDRSVMELQAKTTEFYAKCETPSPPDPAPFFAEALGAIERDVPLAKP